ncbi:adenosylcobalamin-dependent ribonucleoside-diphosphate reductase, partial [Candidatus Dojkabacteria bacterium]|nr:adenosylcobalamin-dependent ribonucleoside-diphosphate reductase [Candidatus Dojkabacteria bacterium]
VMSKCLVLPIEDSIDSIFRTLNQNIQMLRRGVGTGFNFSEIRSTYAKVKSTGENAAGPIEYLKMFNRAQDTIKGRGGRGLGSMAILNVSHPNVEDFIQIKDDLEGLSHYNISIGITDNYMKAVKKDAEWELIDPHSKEVCKKIKARELFQKIAEHAWVSGDPGMFFIDTAEKGNTTPKLGEMNGTNPCGEQPLIPYETCNLGNIDVSKFVEGFPYLKDSSFREKPLEEKLELVNWERLEKVTKLGVRFLDNIIDINNYPIPEIEEMTKRTRNVGLGLMGFADFLIKLGVSYKSEEATKVAEKLMKFIREKAHEASEELGEEKGNFPEFENSTWKTKKNKKYMRNTRVTTIAPTGSVSIIANCNPGIEPIFALGYRRKNSMGGADQEVIEHLFEATSKARGFYSEELIEEVADGKHLSELKEKYNIPEDVVEIFVTTHEIEPAQHVKIQAAFQKHIDSAVSKTINLPNSATWRDIARIYEMAYNLGCKGITVFRDGSKDPALQVGTKDKTGGKDKQNESNKKTVEKIVVQEVAGRRVRTPKDRPDVVKGFTYQIETNQGKLFVTINEDEVGPFEVFLQGVGKSGSFTSAYIEAIGRLASLSMRSGIETDEIIAQLQGIRSGQPTMNKGGVFVYSVPDAVAKIIKKHMDERKEQLKMFEVEIGENSSSTASAGSTQMSPSQEDQEIKELETDSAEVAEVVAPTKPSESESKIEKDENPHSKYSSENVTGDIMECPECGGDLEYAEGCILCRGCGYSKCG